MKLKMSISKRERFLLFTLLISAALALIYLFVISPLMSENTSLKAEVTALDSEKFIVDTQVPQLASLETLLESRVVEVSEILETFESPTHPAEFDQRVIELANEHNIKILSANFGSTEVVTPYAIETLPEPIQYSLGEYIQEYKEEYSDVELPPETLAMVLMSQHEYSMSTSYAKFVYFLEDVRNWDTSIILSAASYNTEESTASFTFDVYYLDQLLLDEVSTTTTETTATGTGSGSSSEDPFASSK